jgi:hypothetical protein
LTKLLARGFLEDRALELEARLTPSFGHELN